MEALQPEDILVQQIPVKGFEVPDIKNDAMTLWNRPFVDRRGLYDVE
jgi:hypothetical protein